MHPCVWTEMRQPKLAAQRGESWRNFITSRAGVGHFVSALRKSGRIANAPSANRRDLTPAGAHNDGERAIDPHTGGLVCPTCGDSARLIENQLPAIIVFVCGACGHRWRASEGEGLATAKP